LGFSGRTVAVTKPGDDAFDILEVRLVEEVQEKSEGTPGLQTNNAHAKEIKMTIDAVKDLRDALPFTPFDIHLVDGRIFPVLHRDFLSIGPMGKTLIVWTGAEQEEHFHILDTRLVASLRGKSSGALNS
jgi:hypothetical protein